MLTCKYSIVCKHLHANIVQCANTHVNTVYKSHLQYFPAGDIKQGNTGHVSISVLSAFGQYGIPSDSACPITEHEQNGYSSQTE